MKSKKKVFVTVLCAAALVVASVLGTMAFLTSTDQVTNTFTVGKVAITLDESPVNDAGVVQDGDRVKANNYKLIPGHNYTKDPTVHVDKDSENSWLFVKVENGLKDIEANTKIEAQILENDWTKLSGVDNVYYREYVVPTPAPTADVNYEVFNEFTLTGDANVANYANAKIKVTAYAIQKDGFATAIDAWNAGQFN